MVQENICHQMDRATLKQLLRLHSPDAIVQELPLLVWALTNYNCVKKLLKAGANPNIEFEYKTGVFVTPLYCCKHLQEQWEYIMDKFQDILPTTVQHLLQINIQQTTRIAAILSRYGAISQSTSDHVCIDICV